MQIKCRKERTKEEDAVKNKMRKQRKKMQFKIRVRKDEGEK